VCCEGVVEERLHQRLSVYASLKTTKRKSYLVIFFPSPDIVLKQSLSLFLRNVWSIRSRKLHLSVCIALGT